MIMDLPEEFSIGNARQKNDAFVENRDIKNTERGFIPICNL